MPSDFACGGAYPVKVTDTFGQAMRMMRKHDPQVQEDGFAILEPIAADVLPRLIAAFNDEPDHGLRCWLLELIGNARACRRDAGEWPLSTAAE
jgi:thymidylate synthase ThyX